MKTLARDLAKGAREWINGDGLNNQIDATGSIVDGKPLYFLETWKLDGFGKKIQMTETRSFRKVSHLIAANSS
jgi:hypothetical protein